MRNDCWRVGRRWAHGRCNLKRKTIARAEFMSKTQTLICADTGAAIASIDYVGSLRGTHNAQNAAAAVAACRAVGLKR